MKTGYLQVLGLIVLFAVHISCSRVDINDEQAVIKDIQGTWTGCEYIGGVYRHIRLNISDNAFDAWIQSSDSDQEPSWNPIPNEKGIISISSVLENPDSEGKYRRITFSILGSCCGDNSSTAWTLSKMITYHDGKGLYVAGRESMARK
jgi:hypothetical protein